MTLDDSFNSKKYYLEGKYGDIIAFGNSSSGIRQSKNKYYCHQYIDMIPPLMPLFPIIVVITLVIIFTTSVQIVKGSLNATMGIGELNTTLPEIDNDYENDNRDTNTNTPTQNCQMPPCPPGEMCIQVCPESVP